MSDSSRLDPNQDFPYDLTAVDRDDLDILNSRNHRTRDVQHVRDEEVDPEVDGQHHELREDLDRRQALRDGSSDDEAQDAWIPDEPESPQRPASAPGSAAVLTFSGPGCCAVSFRRSAGSTARSAPSG